MTSRDRTQIARIFGDLFILISRIPRIYIQSNGPKELHLDTQQDYLVRNKISQRCTGWPCNPLFAYKNSSKICFSVPIFKSWECFVISRMRAIILEQKQINLDIFDFSIFSAILFHNITCKNCHKGSNLWRPFQISFLYPIDC